MSPHKRQKYDRPSVIEVVAEVRFNLGTHDPTLIGQFFTQISEKYPVSKPLNSVVVQINTPGAPNIQAPQVQFWSSNGKGLVQLGQGLLSCNFLGYTSWEDFRQQIEYVVSTYLKLAQPNESIRSGLRYLNRLVLPSPLKMNQFLQFAFNMPEELKGFEAFQFVFVKPFAKIPGTKMRVVIGSTDRKPEETGIPVLFDIDFFSEQSQSKPTASQIMQFNDFAHHEIEQMFESAITEDTRALMGVQK